MVYRSVPDPGSFEPWQQEPEEEHQSQKQRMELEREKELRREVDRQVQDRVRSLPWWRKINRGRLRQHEREIRAEIWRENSDE